MGPACVFLSDPGFQICKRRLSRVVALIVLILLLLLLGGGGLIAPALHVLWIVLVIGLILWVLGFFIRGAEGRGRWYGW